MGEGFLSGIMSGLSSAGNSIGNFATGLVEDGSWLNDVFSGAGDNFLTGTDGILTGKNLSDTLGTGGKLFGAYADYQSGQKSDALKDKAFALQEQQYNDYTQRVEDEDERNKLVDNTISNIWG